MGMLKEFRDFAVKGNVVDLAVAVVLGAAFGGIVTSITESFIMPLISMVVGKDGVKELSFMANGTLFPYGVFLQALINFVIIALVLFFIVKGINHLQRKKETEAEVSKAPELSVTEKLLTEIRDNLSR